MSGIMDDFPLEICWECGDQMTFDPAVGWFCEYCTDQQREDFIRGEGWY